MDTTNSTSYFLKAGTTFRVSSKEALDLHEALPPGNYTVGQDPMGNFFLEQIESFSIPKKLYGDTTRHTGRIISTFFDRSQSTGVMLNGEKGSGKTLLAKNISAELAAQGVPTIVINRAWVGDGFFKLLQDITQPCVILFDEFEKVYDRDGQEAILTLLDGVFGSKKLYLITCNDKWRVDQHMRNRPGRIYYMLDFKGLGPDFIHEYCTDNLKAESQHYIDNIVSIASLFSEFNFDMLKALVEEMNRYNESPADALTMLNAKPEFDSGTSYDIKLIYNGKEVVEGVYPEQFEGNPLRSNGVGVEFDPDPNDNDVEYKNLLFTPESLVTVNAREGMFTFEDKGTRLILTRVKPTTVYYNYDAL